MLQLWRKSKAKLKESLKIISTFREHFEADKILSVLSRGQTKPKSRWTDTKKNLPRKIEKKRLN